MPYLELGVFAIALVLSTINIFVFTWALGRHSRQRFGVWLIRLTGALPGVLFALAAISLMATNTRSTPALALVTASLLLTSGAIALISQLNKGQVKSCDSND